MRARFAWSAVHPVQGIDRAHLDRARAEHQAALLLAHPLAQLRGDLAPLLHVRTQFVGAGHIGHGRIIMLQPVFRQLETGGEVEDRHRHAVLILLRGNHPAVGEAAPVEIALDPIFDPRAFATTTKEIGVQ